MRISKSTKTDVKANRKLPVQQSSDTDKALQHITAAIDILGKSGKKDEVTKDIIANLAVVAFDIKSQEK